MTSREAQAFAGYRDRLLRLDTCVLSDALDALSLPGAVPRIRSVSVPAKVAGSAVTVELVPADATPAARPDAGPRHLCTAAVAAAGPGDVIVVSHPGGTDAAGWGGLLTRAAVARGIEGTLTDGPCRDVDESTELTYPVYATGTTPVTARGRIAEGSWGGIVRFAGVCVRPGDLVLADGSGVVFLPRDRADEVLERAEAFAAREAAMAAAIADGVPVTEVMGRTYEELAGRR